MENEPMKHTPPTFPRFTTYATKDPSMRMVVAFEGKTRPKDPKTSKRAFEVTTIPAKSARGVIERLNPPVRYDVAGIATWYKWMHEINRFHVCGSKRWLDDADRCVSSIAWGLNFSENAKWESEKAVAFMTAIADSALSTLRDD